MALLLGLCLVLAAPAARAGATRQERAARNLLNEALGKIKQHAFQPGPPMKGARTALRAYVRGLDRYSDYLPPKEYAAWRKARDYRFAGVGMDLVRGRGNRLICLPRPRGPAARAGIRSGDVLLAVNGKRVAKESLYAVGGRIRGARGSKVRLLVRSPRGREKNHTIVRRPLEARTVWAQPKQGLLILRVTGFSPHTARELRKAIARNRGAPKVIDLRNNFGGDLFAAVECAGLFLGPGRKIFTLKTKDKQTPFRARDPKADTDSPLFIWQGRHTASAAEVFTAALTQNRRAKSLGQRSFGKGVAQKIIELSDGSALVITYALLVPPNGYSFQGKGLKPDVSIPAGRAKQQRAWLDAVRKAMGPKGAARR